MALDDAGYALPHNRHDTSVAAAEKAAKFSATLRHRAFLVIFGKGLKGATCEEVEQVLSTFTHQSISARLWELAQEYSIFDSRHRRLNKSETEAIVWLHAQVAPEPVVRPYLEYQRAQATLDVIRKTLSNLDRVVPLLGPAELDHLAALKSFLVEQRHALERVPEPPPFPLEVSFATVAAAEEDAKTRALLAPPGSTLIGRDGKEILL